LKERIPDRRHAASGMTNLFTSFRGRRSFIAVEPGICLYSILHAKSLASELKSGFRIAAMRRLE
jgi:hypothetical protein